MRDSVLLREALLSLHLIGLALGLGGAAVADFTFFRAVKLRDRITAETVSGMRVISSVVWLGIGLLTFSGLALFSLHPRVYLASQGFLAKMVFVGILVINGLLLNFYTTARLTTFNFSEKYTSRDAAWRARKLSFVFGAISTITWYATLLTAQFKSSIDFTFIEYILVYLLFMVAAVAVALLIEHFLHTRPLKHPLTIDKLTSTTQIPPPAQTTPTNVPANIASQMPDPDVPQQNPASGEVKPAPPIGN